MPIDVLLILLPLSYILGVIVFRMRDARHRSELEKMNAKHENALTEREARHRAKLTQINVKHAKDHESVGRDHAEKVRSMSRGLKGVRREHAEELGSISREHAEELRMMNRRLEIMKGEHAGELERMRREHAEELGNIRREYIEYHGEPLHIIDPSQYERVVAETVKRRFKFAHVEVTGGPGDKGADIVASGQDEKGARRSAIVQCKMYADDSRVGYNYVRELIGSMTIHNADIAYLVTTSDFASNAVVSEEHLKNRILLVNGEQFNQWRIAAGLAPVIYAGMRQADEE